MKLSDLPAVSRLLEREYVKHQAPVMELIKAQEDDPFFILVGTILSARTQDATTAAACKRLFAKARKPADLRRLELAELEALIHPVGFYHTKARHLKELPDVLDAKFGGRIPESIDELCELPGVGRKTANLVVSVAFDKPGICVDIHVHRICNRLGLIRTTSPLETEMTLREILPPRYWKAWNRHLVSFGQTRCRPVTPKCDACPLAACCDRVGVRVRPARD
ncbi:MAG: endonuclease III [Lentisphaerae bacterium]|nr:endonuclease III [Lentisphaerota bacterium]